MKNLIIMGVSRAGKSTLAQEVTAELAKHGVTVSLIPLDDLVFSMKKMYARKFFYYTFVRPIRRVFPAIRRLYARFADKQALFLAKDFMDSASQMSTIVFEGSCTTLEPLTKLFDPNKYKIVAIGYPDIDVSDKMKIIRKHDVNAWTVTLSDERLNKMITSLVKQSKKLQAESEKLGIPFINISRNYKKTIQTFVDNVYNFLSE